MPLIKHFYCVACLEKKKKIKRNIFHYVSRSINNKWLSKFSSVSTNFSRVLQKECPFHCLALTEKGFSPSGVVKWLRVNLWIVIYPEKAYKWSTSIWKKYQYHWLSGKWKSKWLENTAHKRQEALARMWINQNPCTLLVEMQNVIVAVEHSMKVPQKHRVANTSSGHLSSGYVARE